MKRIGLAGSHFVANGHKVGMAEVHALCPSKRSSLLWAACDEGIWFRCSRHAKVTLATFIFCIEFLHCNPFTIAMTQTIFEVFIQHGGFISVVEPTWTLSHELIRHYKKGSNHCQEHESTAKSMQPFYFCHRFEKKQQNPLWEVSGIKPGRICCGLLDDSPGGLSPRPFLYRNGLKWRQNPSWEVSGIKPGHVCRVLLNNSLRGLSPRPFLYRMYLSGDKTLYGKSLVSTRPHLSWTA